jgi:5,10-methenyltetrahydrofolate synthetase
MRRNSVYNIKRIAVLGLLVALEIVLSRFVSISTPMLKISFAFAPVMIAAMLYGPLWAAAAGALADFIGATFFPIGAYFPGFTLTAALTGAVFGLFLRERPTLTRSIAAAGTVCLALRMGLDTLWLYIMNGGAVAGYIPGRIATNAAMMFVMTVFAHVFGRLGGALIGRERAERKAAARRRAKAFFYDRPELRGRISREITGICLGLPEYAAARTVFCFAGSDREVDTSALIAKALEDGKRLCLPLSERGGIMTAREIGEAAELEEGLFGILAPPKDAPVVPPMEIDLVFVPCLAADRRKFRLGNGGGYYDRYLKNTKAVKIALCPSALVSRRLPAEESDVAMDRIVTEKGII